MQSLRVLQVCGVTDGGTWFTDQVIELTRRGHHVEAVVSGAGSAMHRLEEAGVPVHVLPFRGYRVRDLPRVCRALWKLRRLIASGQFDIVHSHLLKSSVLCRIAALKLPVRLVSQVPGIIHLSSPILRLIDLTTLRRDDLLLASCTSFEQTYRALGVPHTAVAFYGCNTDLLNPLATGDSFREEVGLSSREVAVGMVAYMYPTRLKAFRAIGIKGHEVFIDAARTVSLRNPCARFFIVGDEFLGDGHYRESLEDRAADLVSLGILSFLGHRTDMERILAGMDILVNPSLSESGGGTVIEASLMNRPVVASAVGGLLDSVVPGVTGLLVEPGNSAELAVAIEQLILHPAMRESFGVAGRPHVKALFDLGRAVSSVEASYARVLMR